jgi:hypothetical protein
MAPHGDQLASQQQLQQRRSYLHHRINNRLALTIGYADLLLGSADLAPSLAPQVKSILVAATEAAEAFAQLAALA